MDDREAVDEAALRQYTFNVGDFSRDLAAVTVRLDAARARLVAGAPEARTGRAGAVALPAEARTHQTSKAGSPGSRVAECAAMRGGAVRDTWPGPAVCLVRRRPLETGELKTSLSQALVDTAWDTQVRRSGRRWPIAPCCADGKPRLGRGDDAGRRWPGWQHPRTWVILAHFFVGRRTLR